MLKVEPEPVFRTVGESSLLVELGNRLDLSINRAVHQFDRAVTNDPIPGVIDTAPTLRSLLVRFDPLIVTHQTLEAVLRHRLAHRQSVFENSVTRRWRIPVCYGGDNRQELEEVAALLKRSVDEVIDEHCSFVHTVLTLGFAPGFLYLGLLPPHWHIPRLEQVKPLVPAGSVSVAVGQTVLTSSPIPTGWRTIGVTPFSNFSPDSVEPVRVVSGDEIQFYSIDYDQLCDMRAAVYSGRDIADGSS